MPARTGPVELFVSFAVAGLAAAAALAGLLYSARLYPDAARAALVPTDAATLIVGLPLIAATAALAWRGSLVARLAWPGAAFYFTYTYVPYIFGLGGNVMARLALGIAVLSAYLTASLIVRIDAAALKTRLESRVPARLAGGLLALFGALFLLRAVAILIGAAGPGQSLPPVETGLQVADAMLSVVWLGAGLALVLRAPLGYATGFALLVQGTALFASLLVYMALAPALGGEPAALADFAVIAAMTAVVAVPTVLFARGIAAAALDNPPRSGNSPPRHPQATETP